MENATAIDISSKSLAKIALFVLGIWILWTIRDIIALFFVVLIIVAALSPIVEKMSQYIPRALAILIIYIVILGLIAGAISLLIPPLITQIQNLARELPYFAWSILPHGINVTDIIGIGQKSLTDAASQIGNFSSQIYSTTLGFFEALIAGFTVIVLSFYLLLEEHSARKLLMSFAPLEQKGRYSQILHLIGQKIGAWLRGQLVVGLVVGLVDGIGLLIIGIPYALTLGIFAGITELIPYIGPIIGAIPGVLIAFLISPLKGLIALALYVLVQQLESNFLVPKIMQRAVGLSPVIIILALLIGAKLAGIVGVMLAIPVAAVILVIVQETTKNKVFRT